MSLAWPKRDLSRNANAVRCAVVNLDQFRITTWTILGKEQFRIGLVRPCPRKTKTNEV